MNEINRMDIHKLTKQLERIADSLEQIASK